MRGSTCYATSSGRQFFHREICSHIDASPVPIYVCARLLRYRDRYKLSCHTGCSREIGGISLYQMGLTSLLSQLWSGHPPATRLQQKSGHVPSPGLQTKVFLFTKLAYSDGTADTKDTVANRKTNWNVGRMFLNR